MTRRKMFKFRHASSVGWHLTAWKLLSVLLLSVSLLPSSSQAGESRAKRLSGVERGHCSLPRLSPDGQQVAYERREENNRSRRIYLYTVATGMEQPLPLFESSSALLSRFNQNMLSVMRDFVWNPRVNFQSSVPYVVAGSREERQTVLYLGQSGRLTQDDATEGHPTWSPDGSRLVYVSSITGEGDLYLLELGKVPRLPRRLTQTAHESELFPTFAPQGQQLAFVRSGAQGTRLMMLEQVGLPTQRERILVPSVATATRPAFSPDGQWLAYFSNVRQAEQFDLMLLPVKDQGAAPRMLLQNVLLPERRGPAWTPDSQGLVVVRNLPAQRDPMVWVSRAKGQVIELELGAQQPQDPEVGLHEGRPHLYFCALGFEGEALRWKGLYGMPLPNF